MRDAAIDNSTLSRGRRDLNYFNRNNLMNWRREKLKLKWQFQHRYVCMGRGEQINRYLKNKKRAH